MAARYGVGWSIPRVRKFIPSAFMKLHLPRSLRTAVLTCMAVAGGFATTTATGVLATGSLLVAFATPQAQATVDYSVYADYAFSIYQWTGPTSGGKKGFVSHGYWYEMEYSDGALNYKLANGEKIPSGTYNATTNFGTYIQSDKTIVFDANSNCFANAQYASVNFFL